MLTFDKTLIPAPAAPAAVMNISPSSDKFQNITKTLVWTLVGVGIFLRLYHYFNNRSLFIDEVYLSVSLIKMNFAELTSPMLEYEQKAPVGFLWLVKLSVVLFGKKEMALRLVPLLAGIASLFVFLPVARYFLKPLGVVLAVALMALAPVLVYHSVEIKQYCTEMLATVVALYFYMRYHQRQDYLSLLLWGLWGALMLWFSFSVIFVLAGMAIGLSLHYMLKRDWKMLFLSLIPFGFWLFSFGLNFYLFTYQHTDSGWLVEWFRLRNGFLPQNPSAKDLVIWVLQAIYSLLTHPLGVLWNANAIHSLGNPLLKLVLKMPLVLFLFWGTGLYMFFKHNRKAFLVLSLPLVLTLFAALIEKYPFYERLTVFLAPLLILMFAHGCATITSYFPARAKWRWIFPVILLLWPLWKSVDQVMDTHQFGDRKMSFYREGILYLKERMQPNDLVYVYWNARHYYNYYNEAYNLNLGAIQLNDYRLVSKSPEEYLERLRPEYSAVAQASRVWLVHDPLLKIDIGEYDHQPPWYNEEANAAGALLCKDIASMGKQEADSYVRLNSAVRLFK
ncbi:hypothetical protein D770_18055 [Flammeovirgaceae bacterium 311]|nr:hypothetical protein D770_18055 [Flammeovirgaceae bacterium 311]